MKIFNEKFKKTVTPLLSRKPKSEKTTITTKRKKRNQTKKVASILNNYFAKAMASSEVLKSENQ